MTKNRSSNGWNHREWAAVADINQFVQEGMSVSGFEHLIADGKDPGATSGDILRFENYPIINNNGLKEVVVKINACLSFWEESRNEPWSYTGSCAQG